MANSTLKSDPQKTRNWQMRSRKRLSTRAPLQCYKPMKRGTKKIGPGPKTKAWESARRWLKSQFDKRGFRTCQLKFPGCWFDNALSFAHAAKRRNLREGELYVVCLACTPCHDQLEVMPPADMRRIVEGLFEATKIPKGQTT